MKIFTKFYQNRLRFVKDMTKNFSVCFFGSQCSDRPQTLRTALWSCWLQLLRTHAPSDPLTLRTNLQTGIGLHDSATVACLHRRFVHPRPHCEHVQGTLRGAYASALPPLLIWTLQRRAHRLRLWTRTLFCHSAWVCLWNIGQKLVWSTTPHINRTCSRLS